MCWKEKKGVTGWRVDRVTHSPIKHTLSEHEGNYKNVTSFLCKSLLNKHLTKPLHWSPNMSKIPLKPIMSFPTTHLDVPLLSHGVDHASLDGPPAGATDRHPHLIMAGQTVQLSLQLPGISCQFLTTGGEEGQTLWASTTDVSGLVVIVFWIHNTNQVAVLHRGISRLQTSWMNIHHHNFYVKDKLTTVGLFKDRQSYGKGLVRLEVPLNCF